MFLLSCLAIGLMVMGYAARTASAQVLYGSIVGTLTDETGAVVPDAVVSVKNTSTGLSRQATTDETGHYAIQNLLEGSYDLSVSASGFKPYTQTGVNVSINSVTRVDVRVQVGAITDQVTVEASAAVLQTTKSDVNTHLDTEAIENLPLSNYRNYQSLINLVPGATPAQFQNAITDTPGRGADDQHQRPGSRCQQHPCRRVGRHSGDDAAPCGVRRAGREHRGSEHLDEQLRRRAGDDRRRRRDGGHEIRDERFSRCGVHRVHQRRHADLHLGREFFRAGAQARREPERHRRKPRRTDQEKQAVLLRELGRHVRTRGAHKPVFRPCDRFPHRGFQPHAGRAKSWTPAGKSILVPHHGGRTRASSGRHGVRSIHGQSRRHRSFRILEWRTTER